MRGLFVVALAAVMAFGLAGCGKQDRKQEHKVSADKPMITMKEPGVSASFGGGGLPKDAPEYVVLYPGANVLAVVKNVGGPGTASMVTFDSSDGAGAIAAFYIKQGKQHGLDVVKDENSNGRRYIRMTKGKELLSVSINNPGSGTTVELDYK